jgi:hypothetical protein
MKSDQQTVPEAKISQQSLRDQFWETLINIWSRRTSLIASVSTRAEPRFPYWPRSLSAALLWSMNSSGSFSDGSLGPIC